MKNCWKNFFSPFTKIAGAKALLWGLAGLAVSVAAASFSGFHAHGLMQFGGASRDAWWLSALEYLIIWLIPAINTLLRSGGGAVAFAHQAGGCSGYDGLFAAASRRYEPHATAAGHERCVCCH